MSKPRRIRRRLTLHVSERAPADPHDSWTPGARFATGWGHFFNSASLDRAVAACAGDAIQIAGCLAADAARSAYHTATNWIEP